MPSKIIKNIVIINDFNYVQGGASKVAIETAKLLKENNLKVYFFSAVNKEKDNIEGITYISTNQNEALLEKNKIKGFINGIYNFKAKKELKELLLTLNREETIIHVHGWTKALSSSIFDIAFKMKYKVVLTLHDYFTACPNGGYFNYKKNEICKLNPLSLKCIKCNCDSRNYLFKIYRLIRQFVQNKIVKLNDRLEYAISISDLSEKILKTTIGRNALIKRIYNPIDINKKSEIVNFKNNNNYIYIGRISQEKGVTIFCEAIHSLKLNGIVIGDGILKEELQKKYKDINFVGWKTKEEIEKYIKNAKALIFPSKWYETMGLTVLEAGTLGLPCIVNASTAASEFIVDKKNGFLYSNYDELLNILKNSKIDELKEIKYNYNNNYISKLINLYNKMLGGL